MELTHIAGRTWAVEGRAVTGLYRLDAGRCVLIDSGYADERQALADLLAREGLTPAGVLSTHVHVDHSVNNGWLREAFGAASAVPAGEAWQTESPLAMRGGYMYCYSPGMLAAEQGEMCSPVDFPIPREDGVFPFCGAPFRIVHTPGHSLDHICVVTPDNVCCAGDAVLLGDPGGFKLPYALLVGQMMDSALRLTELDCAAYLICHRGVCRDIGPAVEFTRALLRRRAEEIRALVDRPMTWEEVWRAVNRRFSLLSARPARAAKMERNLRSFLDYLVDTGELRLSAREGLLYLGPAPV